MKIQKTFSLTVFSPFKTYYEGSALLLTAENKSGPFGILAEHANFLCLLSPGTLQIQAPEKNFELPVDKGIVQVVDGAAYVFVGI